MKKFSFFLHIYNLIIRLKNLHLWYYINILGLKKNYLKRNAKKTCIHGIIMKSWINWNMRIYLRSAMDD